MPSSPLLDLPTPLAVACNDAGAANHIFAWMRAEAVTKSKGVNDRRLFAQGPAAKLWAEDGLQEVHQCQTIDEVLDGAQAVVTGTGWSSDLEYNAIKAAHQQGIRSVAVIDNWANYRARFERKGVEVLPDEIWVTDEHAKELAESEFEGVKIVQMPNLYLENLVQEVRTHEHADNGSHNILYVLEPIRDAWGDDVTDGEYQALDYFIFNIDALGLESNPSIRLRPHPSDSGDKYDQWINKQQGHNIKLDKSRSLSESIAWSGVVVGCQTYAMVVALAAGKQVFSSIPPWAPDCRLPHSGVIHLSRLDQAQ